METSWALNAAQSVYEWPKQKDLSGGILTTCTSRGGVARIETYTSIKSGLAVLVEQTTCDSNAPKRGDRIHPKHRERCPVIRRDLGPAAQVKEIQVATPGRILTEVERSGIKKRMDEIGMNQSRLATMLTTGQAYVNKVINGKLPCSDTFLARIENELTAAEAAFARFAADFNAREGIGEASAESTAELEIPVVADESLRAQLEIVLSKLDQVNAEHLAALQETDRLRETLKRNNSVVPQHKPAALNLDRVVHRFPDCTIRDVVDWAYLFGVGLSFSLEPIEAE